MNLILDESTHTYSVGDRVVTSVTQVIRSNVPGYAADDWYLERGKAVHLAVKLALDGKLDWATVDPRIEGRVKSVLKFIDDEKITPLYTEYKIFSEKYGFAGTVDLIGSREVQVIADYKGSLSATDALQIAAYNLLAREAEIICSKYVVVKCNDDGVPRLHWFSTGEIKSAERMFLNFLSVHNFKTKNNLHVKKL